MKVLGPKFKDKSGKIIKALLAMDPGEAARQKAAGSIAVRLDGETLEVTPDAVEIITETLSAGEAGDVLKVGDATVLVRR
jgi:valyl-tRNA synthetase